MYDEALAICTESGVKAVVTYLKEQDDPQSAAKTFHELVHDLYWRQKNIADMVILAQAGIEYGLAAADQVGGDDPGTAYELRSEAKSLAYDLASFTWVGWDEQGIQLTAEDKAVGLAAAKTNLELAQKLEKGALRISRAYWMLGAQQMAGQDLTAAAKSFQLGMEQAEDAGEFGDELINRAFYALAQLLQFPNDRARQRRLQEAKNRMLDVENGDMYIDQVDTAYRIFS